MLKLHGFPASNYFNMVKMALLEKGVPYEDVRIYTSQDEGMLAKSPMGKVPFLETEHGYISETSVILDYIEETHTGPPLYPSDSYDRARVRELIKYSELYLELPARRCYGEAFFGTGPVTQQTKDEVRIVMERGVRAIAQQGSFAPYLFADAITYADIVFLFSYPMAASVAKSVLGWDLSIELPKAASLVEKLKERPIVQRVDRDAQENMREFRDAYGMK
ncbi:MAG: glutathione S-transferase [Pseudomonadota bacterium]